MEENLGARQKMNTLPLFPPLYQNEILRCVVGSTLCGTDLPPSDDPDARTSDVDQMGIVLETPDQLLGFSKPFEQHTHSETDLTSFGLRKFLNLALKGNPTVLALFFVPTTPDRTLHTTPLAQQVQSLYPYMYSQQAGKAFLGYAQEQRDRLLGIKGQKRSGATRSDLVNAYGFDTKYAMHIIRLGIQGIEYLTSGRLTFPLPTEQRDLLLNIRTGRLTLEEVVEIADAIEGNLKFLIPNAPPEPNRQRVEEFLLDTYLTQWKTP